MKERAQGTGGGEMKDGRIWVVEFLMGAASWRPAWKSDDALAVFERDEKTAADALCESKRQRCPRQAYRVSEYRRVSGAQRKEKKRGL